MRIDAVAYCLSLLACCCPHANGGFPSLMSKQDKANLQGILGGRIQIPAELSLFVKYKNKKGKRLAKRWAKNGKFQKNYPKKNLLTMRPLNRTALRVLSKSRFIEYVEPVHRVRALPQGRRKLVHNFQESVGYGIDMVQASQLWNIPNASEVTICVIDSGYALGHPDLPNIDSGVTGSSTRTGYWGQDVYGHGSHTCGVIGAIAKNNQGVVGVMGDANPFKFHIGKCLDAKGEGTESDLIDAFESCIDAGANVISMSLGGEDYSESVRKACQGAYDDGILVVAAAGNRGDSTYSYPASYPEVMSVAAVDREMKIAGFSQYNDQVEIAGPGVDIVSTVTTGNGRQFGYASWSGTSMATPYVAGVAALVWGHFPECSNNQIRNVLIRTANGVGCSHEMGFGVVQAKDAFVILNKEGCIAGDKSPTPLSEGAIGGCFQDSQYTATPTFSPTPFGCSETIFLLELTTDEWAEETSWNIRNSNNAIVGSGGSYRKLTTYVERLCLPQDVYTFTIRDSETDGMCCQYGNGSYSVYFDGDLIKKGGSFEAEDVVTLGMNLNLRTVQPAQATGKTEESSGACRDDKDWIFINPKGGRKKCKYLKVNPATRCQLVGADKFGNSTSGFVSCPATCARCPPTASPSPQPTIPSTVSPTPLPRDFASKPTTSPSFPPTLSPTESPSPSPTQSPTLPPTLSPTTSPSREPSTSPTARPTMSPTGNLTRLPTANPTLRPTPNPTPKPTRKPTQKPTPKPTRKPTSKPTPKPTPTPTRKPTPYRKYSQRPISRTHPTPPSGSPSMCCASGQTSLKSFGSCSQFYHCVNGVVTGSPIPCPRGTLFDESFQTCNHANLVTCGSEDCSSRGPSSNLMTASRCGVSWTDAQAICSDPCRTKNDCRPGQDCWASIICNQ